MYLLYVQYIGSDLTSVPDSHLPISPSRYTTDHKGQADCGIALNVGLNGRVFWSDSCLTGIGDCAPISDSPTSN